MTPPMMHRWKHMKQAGAEQCQFKAQLACPALISWFIKLSPPASPDMKELLISREYREKCIDDAIAKVEKISRREALKKVQRKKN